MELMRFTGGPELMMEGKGRLTLPTRWREALMAPEIGKLHAVKHVDGGLSLYPPAIWQGVEEVLLNLPSDQDNWRRFYLGSACELEIDGAARLLVPPELRDWAGLDKEAKLLGMGAHLELWDKALYAARETLTLKQSRPDALRNMVIR